MAEPAVATLPAYTVPVGASPAPGGKWKGPSAAILLAVAAVLALLVIFVVWRRRYRAKPKCGGYTGAAGMACTGMASMCAGDARCLNAVAQCMPLAEGAAKLGAQGPPKTGAEMAQLVQGLDGPALKACSRAITRVDPGFIAQLAVKYGGAQACVPSQFQAVLANPQDFQAAQNVLAAAAPLVPYALDVARRFPACPGK